MTMTTPPPPTATTTVTTTSEPFAGAAPPRLRHEVLVDHRERPTKCTILPLAGHPDLIIVRSVAAGPLAALTGGALLHPDGLDLAEVAAARRAGGAQALAAPVRVVSAIDCVWKHLPALLARLPSPLPPLVRIPAGFVTAYPRRNKQDLDPAAGLATIEAVFLAGAFFGDWNESLLSRYHFAAAFLAANQATFARYRLGPV